MHFQNYYVVTSFRQLQDWDTDSFHVSRPKWEGGQYDGDEKERLNTLRLAMELGADYVDVELQVTYSLYLYIHTYISIMGT